MTQEKASRFIGNLEVSSIGLGCMPLSGYPESMAFILDDRDRAIQTIHAALNAGINLFDTSDAYSPSWNQYGHNEKLIAEAVRSWDGSEVQKSSIVIATKGGITRGKSDNWFGALGFNSTKDYLYRAVEASASRLEIEKIKLWHHHRVDPKLSIEEQYSNVRSLKDHGIVENIGLCNVNIEQLKVGLNVIGGPKDGGVVSVQNEYSPRFRLNSDVLEFCRSTGIAFLPWSPFGGVRGVNNVASQSFSVLQSVAQRMNLSVFALTIAWHLSKGSNVIPIPGSSQPKTILDSLLGTDIKLSESDINEIEKGLPPSSQEAGTYIPSLK